MKPVVPSIDSLSFSCPHCGAHAAQTWYEIGARQIDNGIVLRLTESHFSAWSENHKDSADDEWQVMRCEVVRTESGSVFFSELKDDSIINGAERVVNLALSECYSCDAISVWVARRVVHPQQTSPTAPPNPDLPAEDWRHNFKYYV